MQSLYFVMPVNYLTNYAIEQQQLIQKAKDFSTNRLDRLLYITNSLSHEDYDVEMHLQVTIPANTPKAIIKLPIIEDVIKDGFGYYVNWGDSPFPEHNISTHTYKNLDRSKTYNIKFFGMNIVSFGKKVYKIRSFQKYLTAIVSFGILGHKFTSLSYAFNHCQNNFSVSRHLPLNITDTSYMFSECINFNQPLNSWSVDNVINTSCMFSGCSNFNQPLDLWLVNNVRNMSWMFSGCSKFNKSLNTWLVNNVVNMNSMFNNCGRFNQPLNSWSTNNVVDMGGMFINCDIFNQPLDSWSTINVKDMSYMFYGCTDFNQSLKLWSTLNVKDMRYMFYNCINFNKLLNSLPINKSAQIINMFDNFDYNN
jgi:hypothetical protein